MHRNHNLSKVLIYAKFVNLLLQCLPEISLPGNFITGNIFLFQVTAVWGYSFNNRLDSLLTTRIARLFY